MTQFLAIIMPNGSLTNLDNWNKVMKIPKTLGIGTRAFCVFSPSGTDVEFTYHPPMLENMTENNQ